MTMRTFLTSAMLIVPFCIAPAHSQEPIGWSFSATLGASNISDEDGAETFDGNAFGWTADIEYRFTPYFAPGFGAFSLGRADDLFNGENTEIEARGYELYVRGIYPLSDSVELYGRVGAANYFVDIEPGSVGFQDALFGDDATDIGIGIDFGRQESFAFRVEGRFLNGGDDETGTLLTVGLNYLF